MEPITEPIFAPINASLNDPLNDRAAATRNPRTHDPSDASTPDS